MKQKNDFSSFIITCLVLTGFAYLCITLGEYLGQSECNKLSCPEGLSSKMIATGHYTRDCMCVVVPK